MIARAERRRWIRIRARDIGFAVLARFEEQGLAREGSAACLRIALELPPKRVVAITTIAIELSARLLERLGTRFEGMIRLAKDAEQLHCNRSKLRPPKHTSPKEGHA